MNKLWLALVLVAATLFVSPAPRLASATGEVGTMPLSCLVKTSDVTGVGMVVGVRDGAATLELPDSWKGNGGLDFRATIRVKRMWKYDTSIAVIR